MELQQIPREQLRPYWRTYGPIVEVHFPVGLAVRDVEHGLRTTPTGYHVLWATGPVWASAAPPWATRELAMMQAFYLNTRARIIFFTCLGDPDET